MGANIWNMDGLAILGHLASLTGLHSFIGGFYTGRKINEISALVKANNAEIKKLADKLYYAESVEEVVPSEGRIQRVERLSDVQQLLSPLQGALGDDLLSTAMITTPERLAQEMGKDPWEVLINIKPLSQVVQPAQPSLIPIVFSHEHEFYVGWQTKGMLITVLGADYRPVRTSAESPTSSPLVAPIPLVGVSGDHPEVERGIDAVGPWEVIHIVDIPVRFRWVPPGSFKMGSMENDTEAYNDERPSHEVIFTEGFWLSEVPVWQRLWTAVMNDHPSHFEGDRRPVECVSYHDVHGFMAKVHQQDPSIKLGLPSEAEWEYACRAGHLASRYGPVDDIAWYAANSHGQTHEVGQKTPNRWGFFDMLGNVWEWCDDGYSNYQSVSVVDPQPRLEGAFRVLRGGGWSRDARDIRAAHRFAGVPTVRDPICGFRLIRRT